MTSSTQQQQQQHSTSTAAAHLTAAAAAAHENCAVSCACPTTKTNTPTSSAAAAFSVMHHHAHGRSRLAWSCLVLISSAAAISTAVGGILSYSRGGGEDAAKRTILAPAGVAAVSYKTSFRSHHYHHDDGYSFHNPSYHPHLYNRHDILSNTIKDDDEIVIYTVPSSRKFQKTRIKAKKMKDLRTLDEENDGGDGDEQQDNQQGDNEEDQQGDNEEEDNQQDNNNGDEEEENEGNDQNDNEDNVAEEEEQNDADQDNQQQEEDEEDEEDREQHNSRDNDDFFQDEIADDYVFNANDQLPTSGDDFYYSFGGNGGDDTPHLWPLEQREIVGYAIAAMALTLGASGGIGGGGVVAPIYLLVMGLSPRVAIPIAAVTVLGGALASTMVNWRRRHPLADRPIIDWDLVLVMQPVVLIGVFLGTFVHQILSEQVLVVLMVLFLSAMARSTLSKAMRMYQAEIRYIRHLKAAQAEPPSGSPSRTFDWGDGDVIPSSKSTEHMRNKGHFDDEEKLRILIENPDFVTLRSDLIEEEKLAPHSKIAVVITIITVLIILNIMVGGGGIESPWGIKCGSPAFWTIHVIMIGFLMTSAWAAQTYLIARHEIKNVVRFDYVHGDIRWNQRAGWLYPVVFMVAGLLAGMFGIGGGVIIVPLLLTIGTHPAVATSTSSVMMFFTNLASTSIYFAFGLILFDYAIVGFFVGFFSAFLGQMLMAHLRRARSASGRKFERNSYITFVIGGVVLVSAVLMTIQYIFSIVEGPNEDYGSLCEGLRF